MALHKLKTIDSPIFKILLLLLVLAISKLSFGQANKSKIIENFEKYSEAPREVSYVHLNKSTYIEGEMLGFKAYLFNKHTKNLSQETRNLYCTISDTEGRIIKKKLLLVENGISSNIFNVDDSLTTGTYIFKAYTNWMRNFDEKNHFQQTFKVIDADNNSAIKPILLSKLKVDLQVLGESGQMLYNIPNTIGIIAKNNLGYGIPYAKGEVVDNQGNVTSMFTLNAYGIAKTVFVPIANKSYTAKIYFNDMTIETPIRNIKKIGVIMTLKQLKEGVIVEIRTNEESYGFLKDTPFNIALHNGAKLKLTEFFLNKKGKTILKFPYNQIKTGTNIITVFDEKQRPILERIFFNKNNLKISSTNLVSTLNKNDSISVKLKLNATILEGFSSLSVSVLPNKTKSYNQQESIISQLYLRPYLNGIVQDSKHYFLKNDQKTAYDLDLVMLTQGWSSYSWSTIFNTKQDYKYDFEQGITALVNINGKKPGTYLTHTLSKSGMQAFEISEEETQFKIENLFPVGDEKLSISFSNQKNQKIKQDPALYVQYSPNKFSAFDWEYNTIIEAYTEKDVIYEKLNLSSSWQNNNSELLDTVVIKGKRKQTKAEKLKTKTINSQVKIIDENDARYNTPIDIILRRLGWNARFRPNSGELRILNPRQVGQNPFPLVYLDDLLLNTTPSSQTYELGILMSIPTNYIDYIDYRFYGIGVRGEAGYIKIYTLTRPKFGVSSSNDGVASYVIPLKFSSPKQFYTPKYQYYDSDFFKEYGVIDWFPELKPNKEGEVTFTFFDTNTASINLYIEGVNSDGSFISEIKTIEINK